MTMRSLKAKLISMTKIDAATILDFKIEIFVNMFVQDKTKVLAHKWFVEQRILSVYWVEFEVELWSWESALMLMRPQQKRLLNMSNRLN